MRYQVKLEWISVLARADLEELTNGSHIWPYRPKNTRHELFDLIKHPNRQGFAGGWGPEVIYWNNLDELGYVWSTHHRAIEIRDWIRDHLFA